MLSKLQLRHPIVLYSLVGSYCFHIINLRHLISVKQILQPAPITYLNLSFKAASFICRSLSGWCAGFLLVTGF